VQETGWGEFTIPITLHFRTKQKAITLLHTLKLFPDPSDEDVTDAVRVEKYDELVVMDPSVEGFMDVYQMFIQKPPKIHADYSMINHYMIAFNGGR
jgi:transcription initiation factor IIF auxiliary subunit